MQWNPDKTAHYDLQRTVNEYDIMVTSNDKTPDSVVKPLALIDLKQNDQNMKCLVTEWAKADEQIINQFVSLYLLKLMYIPHWSAFCSHIICVFIFVYLLIDRWISRSSYRLKAC